MFEFYRKRIFCSIFNSSFIELQLKFFNLIVLTLPYRFITPFFEDSDEAIIAAQFILFSTGKKRSNGI